jgi:hypothetical protein
MPFGVEEECFAIVEKVTEVDTPPGVGWPAPGGEGLHNSDWDVFQVESVGFVCRVSPQQRSNRFPPSTTSHGSHLHRAPAGSTEGYRGTAILPDPV